MLWSQFWIGKGFTESEVAYAKGLGEEMSFGMVEEVLSHPKVWVAGFVIDTVDKIMHGMQLGTAGMHNQVHQWAEQGFMERLLNLLFDHCRGIRGVKSGPFFKRCFKVGFPLAEPQNEAIEKRRSRFCLRSGSLCPVS